MSADNWLCVTKVEDAEGYGIFYCSGDGRESFKKEEASVVYYSPTNAILYAHKMHNEARYPMYYEYGPRVSNYVLKEAMKEHA